MTSTISDTMVDFELALTALKAERWVRRLGWNGKGMHVYLEGHSQMMFPRLGSKGKLTQSPAGRVLPCFVLFNAQGHRQPGWAPSQEDLLAGDWQIIPYEEMR